MSGPQTDDPIWAFFRDCGVTVHLAEVPQVRYRGRDDATDLPVAPVRPVVREAVAARAAAPGPERDAPMDHALEDARAAASAARTLDELRVALDGFDACPLKQTARRTVFGEGPIGAALMIVGEAPGRDEDAAGRPFVGRSGKLLEKMLAAIGLSREAVYISNILPWRPPVNRTPTPIEAATCEVFVKREIALVGPALLVPMGGPAARALLSIPDGIRKQRGRWARYDGEAGPVEALPTYHPAYLLRSPAAKREAWSDLLALRERLEAKGIV